MEGGPFSEYMTQGPWQLQDVLESAGAGGGAAAGGGGGGMQPQGLGQRSPEVIHHLNGQFNYFHSDIFTNQSVACVFE